jgi:hypothetical protein
VDGSEFTYVGELKACYSGGTYDFKDADGTVPRLLQGTYCLSPFDPSLSLLQGIVLRRY